MRKIHMLWMMVLLSGCEKFAEFPALSADEVRRFSASLPFMQVAYGDTAINYFTIQTVVNANDTDEAKHSITIYGFDQLYSIAITMPGDTISTGCFSLDPRHGSVSIFQYGQQEIGSLCTFCFFDLSVDDVATGGVQGQFSGALKNPLTGRVVPIQGSFNNISSN